MKKLYFLGFSLLMLLVTCAGDGRLTNNKAMSALKVALPDCTVIVTGVQEKPQENSAEVKFNWSKCQSLRTSFGTTAPDSQGSARFIHYNDGRWVLTELGKDGEGPWNNAFSNLSIEAR